MGLCIVRTCFSGIKKVTDTDRLQNIAEYKNLKLENQFEELISRINGQRGTKDWFR